MNFKTTYFLFGFLALFAILFFVALVVKPDPELRPGEFILSGFHDDKAPIKDTEIKRIEITKTQPTEQKIVFERSGDDKWTMLEPTRVRIDNGAVEQLLRQLLNAQRSEKDISIDMKAAGLEPPSQVYTLKAGDRSWTINIGKDTPGEESSVVFVTSSDFPKKPIPVAKHALDSVFQEVAEFRSRELLGDTGATVVGFRVKQKGKDEVVLESSDEKHWNFVKPAYGDADYEGKPRNPMHPMLPPMVPQPMGGTGVRDLVTRLSTIRVASGEVAFDPKKSSKESGFVSGNAKDPKFGLEDEKQAEWVFEVQLLPDGEKDRKKTRKETLLIGNKIDEKGELYYARLGGSENETQIVKVAARDFEPIKKFYEKPDELRDRNLVRIEEPKKPYAIRVENPSGVLEFVREGEDFAEAWRMWRGDQSFNTDHVSFPTLRSAVTAVTVKDFIEGKKDEELGLDKPVARVWIWIDPFDKPTEAEKKSGTKPKFKDTKEAIELAFGKTTMDKKVYVKRTRGGTSSVVAVDDNVLTEVSRNSLAYLEKSLQPLQSPHLLSRFTIEKDLKTTDKQGEWSGSPFVEFTGQAQVERGDKRTEVARKDMNDPSKGFVVTAPDPKNSKQVDWMALDGALTPVMRMEVASWHALKATKTELKGLGLDPGNVKLSFYSKDSEATPMVLLLGNQTEDKKQVYAKLATEDMVFLINSAILGKLDADFQDLTILNFNLDEVISVKFTGWQGMEKDAKPLVRDIERKASLLWVVKSPPGLTANGNNLEMFMRGLQRLRAENYVSHGAKPTDAMGLEVAKGALEIEITLRGEKEKEPKILTLWVGKLDNDKYYGMTKQQEGDIFMLSKRAFEELKKSAEFVASPTKP